MYINFTDICQLMDLNTKIQSGVAYTGTNIESNNGKSEVPVISQKHRDKGSWIYYLYNYIYNLHV